MLYFVDICVSVYIQVFWVGDSFLLTKVKLMSTCLDIEKFYQIELSCFAMMAFSNQIGKARLA